MSKFLPQKKRLLEEVFEKASAETTEKSFSGILKYLEIRLKEDFNIPLSYKTFENYYNQMVIKDEDYNIKPTILDDLSTYLEYNNFKEYCEEWKTVEHSITNSPSKVIVHVINKPILRMPEFLTKQSNLGFLGVVLVGSFFAGNKFLNSNNNNTFNNDSPITEKSSMGEEPKIQKIANFVSSKPLAKDQIIIVVNDKKDCLIWDGDHYKQISCEENNSDNSIVRYQDAKKNLIKITRPDTLTVENALGKVWYCKTNNEVEFFNSIGIHPENGKTLKNASQYIIKKYGKQ